MLDFIANCLRVLEVSGCSNAFGCLSLDRPFMRYISTLQMTEYGSQPRIHLINSSNRNCSEIRSKFSFYAIFFRKQNFQLTAEFLSCLPKINQINEMNTRLIRASKMNSRRSTELVVHQIKTNILLQVERM